MDTGIITISGVSTIGVTDLRAQAKSLIDHLDRTGPVHVMRHNKAVAVLTSAEHLARLESRIEDLADQVAVLQNRLDPGVESLEAFSKSLEL